MNLLVGEAVELVTTLKNQLADAEAEVVVCPTFTALHAVSQVLKDSPIAVGGQNCYSKESGAFTGEVSPQMLKDVGCTWTIIGHSERREIFEESDEFLNEKLHFALDSGLKVMFCIGETLEQREGGQMNDVLTRQVSKGLTGIQEEQFEHIAIAYEPVWAIGTGVTATPDQAEEAHAFVRQLIHDQFGGTVANNLRIQYGGSVKPDNAGELMGKPNVNGALVGGASLKSESFTGIVRGGQGA